MDVSPLYTAANRMDDVAGVLRARATLLSLGGVSTHWYSPAARTYFARVEDTSVRLVGCANRISVLADRVRTHAVRILADGP